VSRFARFGEWPPRRSRRPQVVYLTNQLPLPAHSGGQVRESEILRRLAPVYDVHLVAVSPNFERQVANVSLSLSVPLASSITIIESTPDSRKAAAVPQRLRTYYSVSAQRVIADMVCDLMPNLIHVEGYFLMQHVPSTTVPIVLAEENIEYQLDQQQSNLSRVSSSRMWRMARGMELNAWRRATICCLVSTDDADTVQAECPDISVCVVPNGADHMPTRADAYATSLTRGGNVVGYLGNFDWEPSLDAAHVLLEVVWPPIVAARPDVELVIAGAGGSERLIPLVESKKNARLVGPLDNVRPLLESFTVFACPLRLGGGSKLKMLEALRASRPVVTTALGLQGLPSGARDAVILVEDVQDVSAAVLQLLENAQLRCTLSARAAEVAHLLPTWNTAANALKSAWDLAMTHSGRQHGS
jgi:glycosyltransferase involved in cell wall biosynthesis